MSSNILLNSSSLLSVINSETVIPSYVLGLSNGILAILISDSLFTGYNRSILLLSRLKTSVAGSNLNLQLVNIIISSRTVTIIRGIGIANRGILLLTITIRKTINASYGVTILSRTSTTTSLGLVTKKTSN